MASTTTPLQRDTLPAPVRAALGAQLLLLVLAEVFALWFGGIILLFLGSDTDGATAAAVLAGVAVLVGGPAAAICGLIAAARGRRGGRRRLRRVEVELGGLAFVVGVVARPSVAEVAAFTFAALGAFVFVVLGPRKHDCGVPPR